MSGWVGGWVGRAIVSIAIVSILARLVLCDGSLLLYLLWPYLVLCDGVLGREQPDAQEHDEVHDHIDEEVVAERVEILPDDEPGDHVRDERRASLHRHEDALVHLVEGGLGRAGLGRVRAGWGELRPIGASWVRQGRAGEAG